MYRTKRRNLRTLSLLYIAITICSIMFFATSRSLAEKLSFRDKQAFAYETYDISKDFKILDKVQISNTTATFLAEQPAELLTVGQISKPTVDLAPMAVTEPTTEVVETQTTEVVETQITETTIQETEEPELEIYYTENDVIIVAKVIEAEAGGISSFAERAAVAWCILNRVDYTGSEYSFPSTIAGCATETGQFAYYSYTQYSDESYEIAADVLERWNLEQNGYTDVGRTLPSEYLFFSGDGSHNHFRTDIGYTNGSYDWSLGSPYEEDN